MAVDLSLQAGVSLREQQMATDQPAITALLTATAMFNAVEIEVAESLLRAPPEEEYRFLFLDVHNELMGFACYGQIPGTDSSYDLYWIGVHPDQQGRGYGRQLLAAVEQAIAASGGERMYVDTSGRPQYTPTRDFYVAAGYSVVAELPDFYRQGDSKVIYCKLFASSEKARI